jgi:transaldolase
MKFFLDTAEIKEIQELADLGLVDGITTNPTLIANSGRKIKDVIKEICDIVKGPVSAEVVANNWKDMVEEGLHLGKISSNVVIKVPLNFDGLKACKILSKEHGLGVNVTLCFSPAQALLAAKCGAKFVSPFIGRLDDIGHQGMELISEICDIFANYEALKTEVLVASVRSCNQVIEAARIGADVITLPPKILKQMVDHPLTKIGIDKFNSDWQKTGQSIL